MENESQSAPQAPVQPLQPVFFFSKSKILLFAVLGLVGITGIILMVIRTIRNQKTTQQQAAGQLFISPTQAASNSDWKLYSNTKFNYEIKYPQQYLIKENGMGGEDINNSFGISVYKEMNDNIESSRFAINIKRDSLDFSTVIAQHFKKVSINKLSESERTIAEKNLKYTLANSEIIQPLTKISLLGLDAYTYTIKGNFVDNGLEEYSIPMESHKYVWLQHNGLYILISFTDIPPLNQILSTFKLLPSPATDQTANWKTYTNANANIFFKYPSTLTITNSIQGTGIIIKIQGLSNEVSLAVEPISEHNFYLGKKVADTFIFNNIHWNYLTGDIQYCDAGQCGGVADALQTINKGNRYTIILGNLKYPEDTLNQILSTFKFTN